MSATGRLLVATLSLSALVAGCSFPGSADGKAFDPISAPVWKAGYSWTYDVIASSHASGFDASGIGNDGDSKRTSVTMKVINTTSKVGDEEAYVVALSQSADHPLFEGELQAFTKSALELAAIGYRGYAHEGEGVSDPCIGRNPMVAVDPDERFPTLRFPLDDKATWSGRLGFDDEDEFAMEYTINVHGLVDLEVEAGKFQAVYITTDFVPPALPNSEDAPIGMFDVHLRSEQWYSPDVGYLVKSVFTASATAKEDGEAYQFAYRTAAELSSFDLTAGAEQPAPIVQDRSDLVAKIEPFYSLRMVTDTQLPVNIADGAVPIKLSLQKTQDRGGSYFIGPQIETVDRIEPLSYDHNESKVVWTVSGYMGPELGYTETEYETDVLDLLVARGGELSVRASLRPSVCGGSWGGDAFGTVDSYWQKTFPVDVPMGVDASTIDLGAVEVESNPFQALVRWTRDSQAYNPETPTILLTDPTGHTQTIAATGNSAQEFSAYPAGTWNLSWDPGQLPQLGETAEVTVLVTYSWIDDFASLE